MVEADAGTEQGEKSNVIMAHPPMSNMQSAAAIGPAATPTFKRRQTAS
jgi:hypothetical protein